MTLFVHIGRSKAGSSTIQWFLFANRALLARHGVEYPEAGCTNGSHVGLADELRGRRGGNQAAQHLRNTLARHPASAFLISSEYFFKLRQEKVRDLVELAGPHDIKVIAYIRRYPEWIRSNYMQQTRRGRNGADFDAFFSKYSDDMSVFPRLQRWSDVLGWENIRVRSLDRSSLSGGKLTTDILHAVGLEPGRGRFVEPGIKNISPSWMVIEFRRALTALRSRSKPLKQALSDEKRLQSHFKACARRNAASKQEAQYLTPAQYASAASRFNEDVAALNALTGSSIPLMELASPPERPFLPSFETIPSELRSTFFQRAGFRIAMARLLPTMGSPHRIEMQRLVESLRAIEVRATAPQLLSF